jgi:NAD-dependent SIR2 family protein deacetylase
MSTKPDLNDMIEAGARWIAESKRIVVFTGAGISTDSGVPDYRGPDGVWTRRDKGLPPPSAGVTIHEAAPNEGHMAVVELLRMGKLLFLISQNVDNLHIRSGIPLDMIAELHGNINMMKCLDCDRRYTKEQVKWDEVKWGKGYRTQSAGSGQPVCDCGGRIISSVVNFGDPMPEKEMELSMKASQECDLFIVVGSSLVVSPANHFPVVALRSGARLIIINRGETPLDEMAHLRFHEGIADTFIPMVKKGKSLIRTSLENT